MADNDIEAVASGLVRDLTAIHADLRGIRGLSGAASAAPRVIKAVEDFCEKVNWKGAVKKDLAIAVFLRLVPLPPWLPRPLVVAALGFIIEKAVAKYNRRAKPKVDSLWEKVRGWFGAGK